MSIIVDPELRESWPVILGMRYFHFDDGGVTYTVVATDLEHARKILRDSGTEFNTYDGDVCSFDDAKLTVVEWTLEKASTVLMNDEDRGGKHLLHTYGPGDWFCSEF